MMILRSSSSFTLHGKYHMQHRALCMRVKYIMHIRYIRFFTHAPCVPAIVAIHMGVGESKELPRIFTK